MKIKCAIISTCNAKFPELQYNGVTSIPTSSDIYMHNSLFANKLLLYKPISTPCHDNHLTLNPTKCKRKLSLPPEEDL